MRNAYAHSMACAMYTEIFYILESKLVAVLQSTEIL